MCYKLKKQNSKNKKSKFLALTFTLSILYFFIIDYTDTNLISPLLLPSDSCYYHYHEIPWWVELFYMTPASNGHPEGSFFKLFLFLNLSILFGYISSKALIVKLNNIYIQ